MPDPPLRPTGRHSAAALEESANLLAAIVRSVESEAPDFARGSASNLRTAAATMDGIRRSDVALRRLTDEIRSRGWRDDSPTRLGDALERASMVLKDIRQGSLALTDLTLAVPNLVRDGWMEEEFLARLPDTMEHNSTLKGLVIDASGDTPAADCGPLFRALGRSRSVEELTLKNCELTGELARKIMDGCVAQNTSLVTITLLGCTLGDGGVGVVAAALPGCRNLRNIHIIPRDLRGCSDLVEIIRRHWLLAAQDDPKKRLDQFVELTTRALNRDEHGYTKLGEAAECGNAELVQLIFELGAGEADVDERVHVHLRSTPLVVAAMSGHAPVVQLLHDLGANIRTPHGDDGRTPLHSAAQNGHTEVVRLLAGLGAEVNTPNDSGCTPVYSAAKEGHAPVVRLLAEDLGCSVSAPTNDGVTPVHIASSNGHADVLRLLHGHGADVNTRTNGGFTPMFYAAGKGHADVVGLLAELGASASSACGNDGSTPLHIAAENGHTGTVRLLAGLDGVDTSATDDDGVTPLSLAAEQDHVETVEVLAQLGADLDTADTDGTTALSIAAERGHTRTVRLLAELGANTGTPRNNGATAVWLAADHGHTEVLRVLAEDRGADVNTAAHVGGVTPVHVAAQNGHADAVRLLAKCGANVNTQANNGFTPMHAAAQGGHADVVRTLAEFGADINTQTNNGYTPLRTGIIGGHLEAVKSLLLLGARFSPGDLRILHLHEVKLRWDLRVWANDALSQHSSFCTFLCGCLRGNSVVAQLSGFSHLRAKIAKFAGVITGVELSQLQAAKADIDGLFML